MKNDPVGSLSRLFKLFASGFALHAGGRLITVLTTPAGVNFFYKVACVAVRSALRGLWGVWSLLPCHPRVCVGAGPQAGYDELSFFGGVDEFFSGLLQIDITGPEHDHLGTLVFKKAVVPRFPRYATPRRWHR
jgi:hypothetical protein